MVYAVTFQIFWLTKYVRPYLSMICTLTTPSILETRLINYLCALAFNGLPFKSQLAPIQPTPTGKSEHIFISECGPSAEGFKLGPC
jgi:hypothetical protein